MKEWDRERGEERVVRESERTSTFCYCLNSISLKNIIINEFLFVGLNKDKSQILRKEQLFYVKADFNYSKIHGISTIWHIPSFFLVYLSWFDLLLDGDKRPKLLSNCLNNVFKLPCQSVNTYNTFQFVNRLLNTLMPLKLGLKEI